MWGDLIVALLQEYGIPSLLVLALLAVIVIWILRQRVRLELNESASSYLVNLETNRVYRSIVYDVNYPERLPFLALLLYDLTIEYTLNLPRAVQVEQVSYIHPDHDPMDEPTPFSQLGKLIVDHESIVQVVPRATTQVALASREPLVSLLPFYRKPKGVKTIVMEISYPLEGRHEEIIEVESEIDSSSHVLRFVLHKNEHVDKIQQYSLEYELPECIKGFKLPPTCPPEARLPTQPEDILVVASRPIDQFDPDVPSQSNTLNWRFDVIQETTEIRFGYT